MANNIGESRQYGGGHQRQTDREITSQNSHARQSQSEKFVAQFQGAIQRKTARESFAFLVVAQWSTGFTDGTKRQIFVCSKGPLLNSEPPAQWMLSA
jgi:hypothetical protein